jgi:hypothetical protein
MSACLSATFAERGTRVALRQLIVESFEVTNLPSTATKVQLPDAARRDKIL